MTDRSADSLTVAPGGLMAPVGTMARRGETWDHRLFRWFADVTAGLLVLYLFLDRGGAHLHLPKTPAYVAELTLLFGVGVACVGTQWVRRAVRIDPLMGVLVAFMAWGLVRTVPNMSTFGVQDSVRDAALWYYGAFTIMMVAAALAVPEVPGRLARGFSRVVPWLTVWLPTALLLTRSGIRGPHFRWSNVPLLTHKPGNICVAAAICMAWLWLVPDPRRKPSMRIILSFVNLFTIVLGATQTRGGGLAAGVGLLLTLILYGRGRVKVIAGLTAAMLLLLSVGAVTGFAYHTKKRTISVAQLVQNLESVSGGTSNPKLSGSVQFRESLWSTILDRQVQTSHLVDGFGFGPNLATIGGLQPRPTQSQNLQLRSGHNSLLDILARTGLVGAFLWLLLWIGWYRRLAAARRRCIREGDDDMRGVIGVCLVGSTTIFINCFFDPTLEGAQVSVLNFALLAFGILCARRPFGVFSEPSQPGPAVAASPPGGNGVSG
jgi:hypothetical protein